jgi:hypothetical protein
MKNKKAQFYKRKYIEWIAPHIHIFIVCNDSIFLNSFLKSFHIDVPHTIIQYKSGELFLEDSFIEKPQNKHIPVVISDYVFENNEHFFSLNGIEVFEILKHTSPSASCILLIEKTEDQTITTNEAFEVITKNSNTHMRIQNILYAIFSEKNIELQRDLNNILYSAIFSAFIIILGILLFVYL